WDVSLHQQVHRVQVAPRIVRVHEKLLESLQLRVQVFETKGHARVVLVGNEQAIPFRNVDLANLKARLHEAARAQAQELQRCFRLERTDDFARLERLARASRDQRQA